MYHKFIINQDGVLKFGNVFLHRDLLNFNEEALGGGGLWKIDPIRNAIMLYGRSFDFGPPQFEMLRRIDWSGSGISPCELLYIPHWPNESVVEGIVVK